MKTPCIQQKIQEEFSESPEFAGRIVQHHQEIKDTITEPVRAIQEALLQPSDDAAPICRTFGPLYTALVPFYERFPEMNRA